MLDKFIPNWKGATEREIGAIRVLCFDVDDTFSTEGKITSEAYSALWKLHNAGYKLVPITGRAAGWCDHMIRFWPVDAVVGENGAFVYFSDGKKIKRNETLENGGQLRRKLLELKGKLEQHFTDLVFASDQSFRDYDLAIDICEDVTPWNEQKIEELLGFCRDNGAMAKLSSIHVNTWYGDFDKSKGLQKWFSDGTPGLAGNYSNWKEWIFIGDSPNDEPLFDFFDKSVGVANITSFTKHLRKRPSWITEAYSGSGFVEVANRLLQLKI